MTSLTEVHGKGTVEATECQEILQLLIFQNSPARAGLLFIAPNYTVVCMARLFFTYAYGSWGICKGKLSKRKSNNVEVSLQKHRAADRSAVPNKRTTDQLNSCFFTTATRTCVCYAAFYYCLQRNTTLSKGPTVAQWCFSGL